MITRCALVALLALVLPLSAEPVPLDEARSIARKLSESLTQAGEPPFSTLLDAEKPSAVKSGEVGAMLVPDRSLDGASLTEIREAKIPVGVLWTLRLIPAEPIDASAAAPRVIAIPQKDGGETRVNLFFLAIVRNSAGALELLAYGKGEQPVARAVLQPITGGAQDVPVELSGERVDDQTGRLKLTINGQFEAELLMKRDAD